MGESQAEEAKTETAQVSHDSKWFCKGNILFNIDLSLTAVDLMFAVNLHIMSWCICAINHC